MLSMMLSYAPLTVRSCLAHRVIPHRRGLVRLAASQEYSAALAFDLETTGLDVRECEIVQIAIVVANSRRNARFCRLVLPEGDIDPGAAAVHGYTREALLAANAAPFATVWAECEAWLRETLQSPTRPLVWAAHNGNRFDRPILTRCVGKHASEHSALLGLPRASFVDTLSLARTAMPGRRSNVEREGPYTLSSLYRAASGGGQLLGAHDALADAEALALVWKWLIEDVGADAATSDFQDHLQRIGYPSPKDARQAPAPSGLTPPAPRKRAPLAASATTEAGDGSLLRISGVGPKLKSRLVKHGIKTIGELEETWRARGSSQKMKGWLIKAMPGMSPVTIVNAVKGMKAEFEDC